MFEKMFKFVLLCVENQDFEIVVIWQEKVYKSYEVLYGNEYFDIVSFMVDFVEIYIYLVCLEEFEVL